MLPLSGRMKRLLFPQPAVLTVGRMRRAAQNTAPGPHIRDFIGLSIGKNVRFGSKADVTLLNFDARFTPESGHSPTRSGCLLRAISGHHPDSPGKTGFDAVA